MMKRQLTLSIFVTELALAAALFFAGQPMNAQRASDKPQTQTQQQGMQPGDQETAQKTYTGVIMKSGDKLVLTDTASKTSYQLDDQMKAQDFVNKNVKVTGVLDASTGTIRVSAINPI